MSLPQIKGVTKEILASTAAGLSGATRVGISAISSLPGAANVQQAIEQLAQRSGGPAKTDAIGTLKASKAPTDPQSPTALVAEEKGAVSGLARLTASQKHESGEIPFGVAGGTVAQGNDGRLSDSRAPTPHKGTHVAGGTDALTPSDIGAVPTSQRGAANGVATLGADAKIPNAQLSPLAISETFVVNTQTAMLALSAQVGDVAVRTDSNRSYILRAEPAATLANWQELLTPTDTVLSVDGRTGTVSLSDLYAAANDSRLHSRAHNLSSSTDHPDVKAAPSDGQVYVYRASGASGAGYYPENPASASVPSADEAQEGKTRQATAQQVIDGPAGNLFATVARLAAEFTRQRLARRGHFAGTGPKIFNAITAEIAGTLSADLRGTGGIPLDARGVYLSVVHGGAASQRILFVDSADAAAVAVASPRTTILTTATAAQLAVPLGDASGANGGKVKMSGSTQVGSVDMWVTGWWR